MKTDTQKGFVVQGAIVIIALLLISGGTYYVTTNKVKTPKTSDDSHILTESAELYTKYATTTEPLIKITSPNGGEKFVIDGGDINASIPVNFTLKKPQGFSVYLIDSKQNVTASWATDNRFNSDLKINYKFNVNSLISSEKNSSPTKAGEYKIKVCDYDGNNCDISDNYFTITDNR